MLKTVNPIHVQYVLFIFILNHTDKCLYNVSCASRPSLYTSICTRCVYKQAVRVATQYASAPCKLTISSHLFATWHLFRHVGYLRHQQQVDLKSGVRVTCDVGYLCANFSLPRPLCSRVRPDVRDRQTDVRQKHRLMPPPYGGGGIITLLQMLPTYHLTRSSAYADKPARRDSGQSGCVTSFALHAKHCCSRFSA